MSAKTYRILEVVGSSTSTIEDAIQGAIEHASKQVTNIRWFEVLETRGHVENGKIAHYQVSVKIGYTD